MASWRSACKFFRDACTASRFKAFSSTSYTSKSCQNSSRSQSSSAEAVPRKQCCNMHDCCTMPRRSVKDHLSCRVMWDSISRLMSAQCLQIMPYCSCAPQFALDTKLWRRTLRRNQSTAVGRARLSSHMLQQSRLIMYTVDDVEDYWAGADRVCACAQEHQNY